MFISLALRINLRLQSRMTLYRKLVSTRTLDSGLSQRVHMHVYIRHRTDRFQARGRQLVNLPRVPESAMVDWCGMGRLVRDVLLGARSFKRPRFGTAAFAADASTASF